MFFSVGSPQYLTLIFFKSIMALQRITVKSSTDVTVFRFFIETKTKTYYSVRHGKFCKYAKFLEDPLYRGHIWLAKLLFLCVCFCFFAASETSLDTNGGSNLVQVRHFFTCSSAFFLSCTCIYTARVHLVV